jgi:hypothetical protein
MAVKLHIVEYNLKVIWQVSSNILKKGGSMFLYPPYQTAWCWPLTAITKQNIFTGLTFILLMWRIGRAPNSIPIYSYIQEDATLHSLFISGNM